MVNKYGYLVLLLVLTGCLEDKPDGVGIWQDCYNHYRAKSYRVATASCEESFQTGSVHAAWLLGHLYYYDLAGEGASKKQGFKWYLKAAEMGWPEAQTFVGESFMYADGANEDFEKAYYWLSKAAQFHDANAEFAIGMLFYEGKGRAQDISTAISWFKKAANKKHVMSINNLTWIFATSPHKAFRNAELALEWANKLDTELLNNRELSTFLDTKAAAYALAENFEQAINFQTRAIDLLPNNVGEKRLFDFQKHLESYQSNRPWQDDE